MIKNLLIRGSIFEVFGMFLVKMSMYIVRLSKRVIINVIFFLDFGGNVKENIVKVVKRM